MYLFTQVMTDVMPQALSPEMEKLYSAVALSYLWTHLVQRLKMTDVKLFGWINKNTPWVTRTIVAILSAGTAAGVHKIWTPDTGTYGVSGFTIPAILLMIKYTVVNYAMQHGWWKVLFASREPDLKKLPTTPVVA